jgi:NADPH-dependent 2,4-dienoyl-CoA reductase/sulfur reductase-like enzyme
MIKERKYHPMKFIIIGGDAAGMSAASRAKRNKPEMSVCVYEQTQDVSYSACGMPYNIADASRDIDDLVVRKASVFREKQNIDLKLGHRVEAIDISNKQIMGTDTNGNQFLDNYDTLLIATGASPIIPDLPGFDLPGVFALKSLGDGRKIKQFLNPKIKKAIIVGMGYIALEMAESFHNRGIEVSMIKPRPQLLPWLSPTLANRVLKELQSHDVQVLDGHSIDGIESYDNQLKLISKDVSITGNIVMTAIGVKPNSQLAKDALIKTGPSDAILVDTKMATTGIDIYAAGDCASAIHKISKQQTWIPLALYANRGGWTVADNVCGKNKYVTGIVGTAVFKVFGLEVARTGLNMNEAKKYGYQPVEMVIQSRSRAHAHPGSGKIDVSMVGDISSGRLLGVQMVGEEGVAHRINAPAIALHANMLVEDFALSDLAYAPPFSPVWDPMLTAANQLLKKM